MHKHYNATVVGGTPEAETPEEPWPPWFCVGSAHTQRWTPGRPAADSETRDGQKSATETELATEIQLPESWGAQECEKEKLYALTQQPLPQDPQCS